MISGPVVVQVLEGENAMQANRDVMGATNPKDAEPGTIRKELAESIEANTVHGPDSDENAAIEIAYFFKPEEIVGWALHERQLKHGDPGALRMPHSSVRTVPPPQKGTRGGRGKEGGGR